MNENSLKDKLAVPVVSILLTGLVGSGLTVLFNHLDWKARTEFETAKAAAQHRREEIKRIMTLCQKRSFLSSMILNYAEEGNTAAVRQLDFEYAAVIREWNFNLHVNRLTVEQLFSATAAELFCDQHALHGDVQGKTSVHARFFFLGKEISRIMQAARKDEKAKPADLKAGFAHLRETSDSLDAFYKAIISYY